MHTYDRGGVDRGVNSGDRKRGKWEGGCNREKRVVNEEWLEKSGNQNRFKVLGFLHGRFILDRFTCFYILNPLLSLPITITTPTPPSLGHKPNH